MREKWALKVGSETAILFDSPDKFVDAISSNFMNVGFIHYIFPEALILHIYRDPMDTLFHASTGRCGDPVPDYASSFEGLSSLYKGYRTMMDHWEYVLPGRVTHLKYEDLMRDTPTELRKILDKAGLPWDERVNLTARRRKGPFLRTIGYGERYQTYLNKLRDVLGDKVRYDVKI
mmetsp:Transcript_21904/g.49842  ORF Transcript_21904/g.49842 Transcript_21904/m.49842 type:complete len:175 (+) Transcript_21904:1956-2480(+)